MSFGFPAYHTEFYTPENGEADLFAGVKAALKALKWPYLHESDDKIIAKIGYNLFSFGEKITIKYYPDNSLVLTSKCVMVTQCLDWGKNKRNIKKFVEKLRGICG